MSTQDTTLPEQIEAIFCDMVGISNDDLVETTDTHRAFQWFKRGFKAAIAAQAPKASEAPDPRTAAERPTAASCLRHAQAIIEEILQSSADDIGPNLIEQARIFLELADEVATPQAQQAQGVPEAWRARFESELSNIAGAVFGPIMDSTALRDDGMYARTAVETAWRGFKAAMLAAPQAEPVQQAQGVPAGWKLAAFPVEWTPGGNWFNNWCSQWFGPDADDDYIRKAVQSLLENAPDAAPQAEPAPRQLMARIDPASGCVVGYFSDDEDVQAAMAAPQAEPKKENQ